MGKATPDATARTKSRGASCGKLSAIYVLGLKIALARPATMKPAMAGINKAK